MNAPPPDNEMQLTRPVQVAASQLISSVMRTLEGAQEQGWLNEQTAS
jgi:hypothetical protein